VTHVFSFVQPDRYGLRARRTGINSTRCKNLIASSARLALSSTSKITPLFRAR
jgi:hypothetical protein